jgi:hypothetical protein
MTGRVEFCHPIAPDRRQSAAKADLNLRKSTAKVGTKIFRNLTGIYIGAALRSRWT